MLRFGQVARTFVSGFREWDARSKSAFVMALVLLLMVAIVGGRLPSEYRSSVVIGVVGLLVVMQAIFLYANRGMITTVTKAQRLILDGRFEEALLLLEAEAETFSDARALTLLGNAQRMLGRVEDSRQTLTKALQIAPNGHFPLYSIGRTLMAIGEYAQASELFRRALEHGAPQFAEVDLAEASFRSGRELPVMQGSYDEPHVALMASYVLWRTGKSQQPDAMLIELGLPYWEKSAARFAHTRYGIDLQDDLTTLRGLPHNT